MPDWVAYVANVGFPCVIALLFWRHIDTREARETEVMEQLVDRIDRMLDRRD